MNEFKPEILRESSLNQPARANPFGETKVVHTQRKKPTVNAPLNKDDPGEGEDQAMITFVSKDGTILGYARAVSTSATITICCNEPNVSP